MKRFKYMVTSTSKFSLPSLARNFSGKIFSCSVSSILTIASGLSKLIIVPLLERSSPIITLHLKVKGHYR